MRMVLEAKSENMLGEEDGATGRPEGNRGLPEGNRRARVYCK